MAGAEKLEAAAGFSCPTCRAVCTLAVEALQLNFVLLTGVEAESVWMGQAQLVCQKCDEDGEPTNHCQECSLLLCGEGTKHYRRKKLCKHHILQPIEEFN